MVQVVPTEGSPVEGENAGKDHASPNKNGSSDIVDTANNDKNQGQMQTGNDAKKAPSSSPPAARTADGASAGEEGKLHVGSGAATDADVSAAAVDGDNKPQQQALPAATKDPSNPAHADETQQQALPGVIADSSEPPDDSVKPDSPVDPTASTGDPSKPPDGDESQQQGTSAVHTAEDGGGPEAVPAKSQLPPPTLEMDKHSGMTTFSLMRQDEEGSSLDASDAGKAAVRGEQEDGQYNKGDGAVEILAQEQEGFDGEGESEEPVGTTFARRGTRRFVRQGTGISMADGVSPEGKKKKKAPFHVPPTMYMGHPVGSMAAEFLERQKHRLVDVKNRREEVAGLLKLVVDHNPRNTGSDAPDIDKVFPDKRGRDNSQGDWCI
ncbi:unnamed protein product [Ectocarpus sp. CCAP 1310/34]|nr:unnamed protein product [Ectocarpus sp. CCAP 1310/34]